jgi:hypothetical protein
MSTPDPYNRDDETTHERPSSFREMLYRDHRLLSRRKMDRRLRDRAVERDEAKSNGNGDNNSNNTESYATYFPALSRLFGGGAAAEVRAVVVVVVLVAAAFFFGRWVGQRNVTVPAPQSMAIVSLI